MDTSQAVSIKNILTEAVKRGAADLHFSVGNVPTLRIDDRLVLMEDEQVITQTFMEIWIESLLSKEMKAKLEDHKEIIITENFDKSLRFKINIFYQKGFLSATLRYIPSKPPNLDSLNLEVLKGLARLKSGLVLVSGPFGSGRSTTATALIEEINRTRKEYIITIEDPLEYLFVNNQSIIEQREVGVDTNSFVDALRYFQEEDGDVLYLEEMSSPDVIPIALEIARSGALVISSISANSATETLSRILDSFTSFDQERIRDLLSSALKAVVCQKLLPKIGGGLAPALEIVMVNDAIKSIIAGGSLDQLTNTIHTSRVEGMLSFEQSLAELVRDRKISRDDAISAAPDKKKIENLL